MESRSREDMIRDALTRDAAPGPTPRVTERAQPPIKWPHPRGASVAVVGLWLVGLIIALAIPAMIVGPGEENAEPSAVWTAFAITVVGAAIMIAAATMLWRRTKDSGALLLGTVPAISVVIGGVILAAVKLAV